MGKLAKAGAWISGHATLATAAAGVAVAGVVVVAGRNAQPRSVMPPADGTPLPSGAAGTDPNAVAAFITQGAGLALQGAGLGLGVAQGGLDLAGLAVSATSGIAGILAGSQVEAASRLGSVAESAIGILPSFAPVAGIQPQLTIQPLPLSIPGPAPIPIPRPAPAPAPAPTLVGYRVIIEGAGSITGYIVSSTCTLSPRTLSFGGPSSAAVARGTCNGRVYWRSLGSGGYSGASYVAGLSGGPWRVVREMSDGSRVPIGQSGS